MGGASCYVYDLDDVLAAAGELRSAVPSGSQLYYSLKANPHPAVAGVLAECGFRAEVSSVGELDQARRAGFSAAEAIFTGPGKTEQDLRSAITRGVRTFSCESVNDLRRLEGQAFQAGEPPRVLLRINGLDTGNASGLRMANTSSQFGLTPDDIERALAQARTVRVVGMHFYTISNAQDAQALVNEHLFNLGAAHRLAGEFGIPLDLLDLGGGFASPYARPGSRPDYRALRPAVEAEAARLGLTGTTLAFESGRFLVGGSGSLLTEVVDVKQSRSKTYVVLASGINHLGGMSGLRRLPPASAVFENLTPPQGEPEPVTLVGPLCTPVDILSAQSAMPRPRIGDVLRVPNVGAYGLTASLVGFLGHDAPTEVAMRAGEVVTVGRLRLSREDEQTAGQSVSAQDVARRLQPLLAQHAPAADASAEVSEASLTALRGSGLFGLLVPKSHGGLGGSLRDMAEVATILGAGCVSTAMIWAMHCQQVDAVVRFGPAELRERVLPEIARGECYIASVTSERAKGGDLLTSAEGLVDHGDRLWLERDAPIVTGGLHADAYLVTMRSAPEAPPNRVTLVWADRAAMAVERLRPWDTLGMRGTESVGLNLRGFVPRSAVIGDEGDFRAIALESFVPVGHIGWAAAWLGAARGGLARVASSMRSRERSSVPAAQSDLAQARLAEVRSKLEAVSAYLWQVVAEVEELRSLGRRPDAPATQIHLNTLKVLASTLTYQAIDECVQLVGLNHGYRRDSDLRLESLLRDLRSASLNFSNDRVLVASGVLGLVDTNVQLVARPGFDW
ncbi:acyl-CoA dehydrogenase family protein [Plantactinospora sp. S1510]|uniref:Acyl-CoA dehydrogenase family protein n=2 Tax=Plantactinospora alkalitolerans TaxID=2789879 RepID=A0ABS0GQT1_9ACTN|nr:acyl-CoA dehydrogenase family protein [Plantactinospora alkalitolerans]